MDDIKYVAELISNTTGPIQIFFDGRKIYHSSSETHEKVLEVSPGRFAHSLAVGTIKSGQTGDKLSVALTQLVTAAVSSFSVSN